MKRFTGKTALVTGAGGGIGGATALRLAEEGAALILVDRKVELLDNIGQRCHDAGSQVVMSALDQSKHHEVAEVVTDLAEEAGGLDLLFANAGYGKFGKLLDSDLASWDRHVSVNLNGTFAVTQAAARVMAAAGRGGSIVINASSGASQWCDLLGAYCVTKAGLKMLATGLAAELGVYRIRVNAVMPGVVESAMTAPMLTEPALRQVLLSETPTGKLGRPENVAATVAFLLSEDAEYVNGHAVMVDGGQTIHGHPRWFQTDYTNEGQDEWEPVK
jgi:NAD(P)-dependent dehydrogenase (short-subunit alcohol dehydrogenase family)